MVRALIVDALARGSKGRRIVTVDVIGVGPRAVAGLLEVHGVKATVKPLEAVLEDPDRLASYDILMVSAMTSDEEAAKLAVKLWRRWNNGPAILGGPVTADPTSVPRLGYDLGVYGEAEVALPRVLEKGLAKGILPEPEALEDIAGVITSNGRLTARPPYAPRERLAYMHSVQVEHYPLYWASRVYVEVVRGCSNFRRPWLPLPGKPRCMKCPICRDSKTPLRARLKCPVGIPAGCGYCSVPELYGPARSRPLNLIVREVKELIRRGVRRIVLSAPDILDYGRDYLVDPEPLTDPCRPPVNLNVLEELLARITEIPEIEAGEAYVMIENVKACLVDESVSKLLGRYLKGTPVHIGAESGDDTLLDALGRPSTTKDIERAVKLLAEAGLEPYVYFIYALPGETPEAVKRTVEFMEKLYKLGAVKVTAYRFRPLPGTAFEDVKTSTTRYSLMIKDKAKEINERAKARLLGKTFKAIIAGFHPVRRKLVAYPLPHGPVVLLDGPKSLIGWMAVVRVVDVESDRMVSGVLVKRIRRVASRTGWSLLI